MSFQLITPDVVQQLRPLGTNDSEAPPYHHAEWYADVGHGLLAAIMRSRFDAFWRFAIFERDLAGEFRKVKGGEDFLSEDDARVRMDESAQEFLADSFNVNEDA